MKYLLIVTLITISQVCTAQLPNVSISDDTKVYAVRSGPLVVYGTLVQNFGPQATPPVRVTPTRTLSNTLPNLTYSKLAGYKVKFLITGEVITPTGKYYRIKFLNFLDNASTQAFATSKPRYVSVLDQGQEFFIYENDFLAQCAPAYTKRTQASIGFIFGSYVTRLGRAGTRSSDNDISASSIPALEVKWRINQFHKDTYFGFLLGCGPTSATVSESQFPSGSTQAAEYHTAKPVTLISFNGGPFISVKGAYFALLLGFPISPSGLNQWNYAKAATISLGIGVSVFKLTNDNSASGSQTVN